MRRSSTFTVLITFLLLSVSGSFYSVVGQTTKTYGCVVSCCIPGWIMSKDDTPIPLREDLYGPGMELYREIERRMLKKGVRLRLIVVPPGRSVKLFDAGKIDMIYATAIRHTPDQRGFQSSHVVSPGGYLIFTRQDRSKLNSVRELENMRVAVVVGYGLPEGVMDNTAIQLIQVRKAGQGFKMLAAKRVDALLIYSGIGPSALEASGARNVHHGEEFDRLYIGSRFPDKADSPFLLATFNRCLSEMIEDGTYQKLLQGNDNQNLLWVKR